MRWLRLSAGEDKPAWAALFGAAPMVYLFFDPYQHRAPWYEWVWTGIALMLFLSLYVVAAIYWSRKQVMLRICIAMTCLAITFTAYRPGGILFFIYVAAFGPVAFAGHLVRSALIIATAMLLIAIEWSLFWPSSAFPFVTAAEAFLIGGATTFVSRQQAALRTIHKTVERERIARDLHDILGHTLSVIVLKSELACRLLERDPQRAKAEIEEVQRISRHALSEVREAIVGYHAGDLLTEFARAQVTLEAAGIAVERRDEAIAMPLAYERVLALVVREAVTNIVRHAQAKHCQLGIKQENDNYRLLVHDDGKGGLHAEGMGMRGIRERIAALNGTVLWETEKGTALVVTVPAGKEVAGEFA